MLQQLRIIWRIDKRNPLTVVYRQGIILYSMKNKIRLAPKVWGLEIERT